MKLKTIFSYILVAAAFACDSTNIPLDTREGQIEIAEEDGEDTDSLVLPYQTTGSFLTMLCPITYFGNDSSDSVASCRIEDGETKEKYRGEVTWAVKALGVDITTGSKALAYSASEFNAEISFQSGYEGEATITATLPEFGGSLTVKTKNRLSVGEVLTKGLVDNELTVPEATSLQAGLGRALNGFLHAGAFCSYYGLYHGTKPKHKVDTSKSGGASKLCPLGGIVDGLLGTETQPICAFDNKELVNVVRKEGNYCIHNSHSIGEGRCQVYSLVKRADLATVVAGDKIKFDLIVLASGENLPSQREALESLIQNYGPCPK